MKRYIKSNTSTKQTLREYLEANRDRLQGQNLIIADLTPYPGAEPDDQGYIDCPGVLFDGFIEDLENVPIEITLDDYNYLTQDDLDRCVVKEVRTYGNGIGVEIIVENYL